MRLLAIDPGVKATGLALFEEGRLVDVQLAQAPHIEGMIEELWELMSEEDYLIPDRAIVERPTVYHRGGKGDPNDLVSIAIVGGAAAGIACASHTNFVEPRTWKGSVPKDVHNTRIIRALSVEETRLFNQKLNAAPKSLLHNAIDAVGIGLYKLGRM